MPCFIYKSRNICYVYLTTSYIGPENKLSMIGYTLDWRLSCLGYKKTVISSFYLYASTCTPCYDCTPCYEHAIHYTVIPFMKILISVLPKALTMHYIFFSIMCRNHWEHFQHYSAGWKSKETDLHEIVFQLTYRPFIIWFDVPDSRHFLVWITSVFPYLQEICIPSDFTCCVSMIIY